MQVILREGVKNLGETGDVVTVTNGYGRNYLIPKGFATLATPRQINQVEHDRRQIKARAERLQKEAQKGAKALEAATVNIPAAVGEENKLFGAVTSKDVETALRDLGFDVSRKSITLPDGEPIKSLGMYTVDVKLQAHVSAKVKIWVVAK